MGTQISCDCFNAWDCKSLIITIAVEEKPIAVKPCFKYIYSTVIVKIAIGQVVENLIKWYQV